MVPSVETQLETARKFAKNQQLAEAENAYRGILESNTASNSITAGVQENALYELAKLYQQHK